MPNFSGPSNSPQPSTAAMPVRAATLTFTAVVLQLQTAELFADGLPGLNAWFRQTAGAGAVTVQLEFMQGLTANLVIDWQPLVPAFGLALLVPSLVGNSLGSPRYRATITSTGVATVQYRLVGRFT